MNRSRGRSFPFALVCAGVVSLFGGRVSAAEDLPALKRLFDLGAQHADYVLVIDTSGSMKPLWPAVVRGAEVFIEAIPDGEHVSLVFFDVEATASRILPRTLTGANRSDLLRELRALASPRGSRTDLGLALEKTVAELVRPEANRLQFVFFLSDFAHDPAAASRFASRDPSAAGWPDLARRFDVGRGERLLQTFALLLPLGGEVGRDLRLVETVLGPLETVSVGSPATLEEWFRRRRAEIERDKLRTLVRDDLARGWVVDLDPSGRSNRVTRRNLQEVLPLSLAPATWATGDLSARELEAPATLPPLVEATSELVVTRPAPESLALRLLTTRRTARDSATLELRALATAQPADEIRWLGIDPESWREAEHAGPANVLREGTAWWWQVLIALALVAVTVFAWRTWLRPRPLLAWHFRRVTVAGTSGSEQIAPALARQRRLLVGNTPEAEARVSVSLPAFCVAVESRRPRFPLLRPRRGVYIWKMAGPVKVERNQFDPKRRLWAVVEVDLPSHERRAIRLTPQTKIRVRLADQQATLVFQR